MTTADEERDLFQELATSQMSSTSSPTNCARWPAGFAKKTKEATLNDFDGSAIEDEHRARGTHPEGNA
jgi:hypothetical protein